MGSLCSSKKNNNKVSPKSSAKHSKDSTDYSKSSGNTEKKLIEIIPSSPCAYSNPSCSPTRRRSTFKQTSIINLRRNSEGTKMLNHYELQHVLGIGSYGKVRLAIKRRIGGEEKFALKLFKKSILRRKRDFAKDKNGNIFFKDALDDVKREIAIMKKLFHPNIIKLFEVIDNPHHEKLYMVLEYAEGGQLVTWDEEGCFFSITHHEYAEKGIFPESFLRKIFRDCLKGLHYLHLSGIIHRDLKPQNILLDAYGNAKIADFGVSIIIDKSDEQTNNTKGTYQFMSPEFFLDKKKKGIPGKAADIWAIGVTLYCLVFLQLPFLGESVEDLIKAITKQKLKLPKERKISPLLKDLFVKILEKNQDQRITLAKLLQHPWINMDEPMTLLEEIEKNSEDYIIPNVSEKEVDNAVLPIERVVLLKNFIRKIKTHLSSKLSDSSISINSPIKYPSPGKVSSSIIKEDLNEHFTFSKKNTLLNNEDQKKSFEGKNNEQNFILEQSLETPEKKNSNSRIKPMKINTKLSIEGV